MTVSPVTLEDGDLLDGGGQAPQRRERPGRGRAYGGVRRHVPHDDRAVGVAGCGQRAVIAHLDRRDGGLVNPGAALLEATRLAEDAEQAAPGVGGIGHPHALQRLQQSQVALRGGVGQCLVGQGP